MFGKNEMTYICGLPFLTVFFSVINANDLLTNSDFEHDSINPWECNNCTATISHISYHGNRSIKVVNRFHDWSGLRQALQLSSSHSTNIKCRAYIKLLNMPQGKMYTRVQMVTSYTTNGKQEYHAIGRDRYHQLQFDWTEIGGDFTFPTGTHDAKLYIQIDDPSVNYLLDYASCNVIDHDSQWKAKANQRIETLRKGRLNINLSTSPNIDTNGLTIQIKQIKSKFAFGTVVKAPYYSDNIHKSYQDFINKNFEWAVLEGAFKWNIMEQTKGHIYYALGMDAVTKLRNNGLKVRGHNMFWAVASHEPKWLARMSSSELLQEMHTRVNGMMSHSKGTLEHWDVNNENLHGDYFEKHTGNPNITMDMFKWMYAHDPYVKLFLNEYEVINSHMTTTAYKEQGKRFKDSGVPIYGLGVQSHFKSSHLNMDILKYRLDKIEESGLPIWITELTILDTNETMKAAALDDVMTLYFSHPAVEGVLLWGFWDHAIYDPKLSLATGTNITPNAAGRKWQELFHQRFRTNENHSFNGRSSVQAKVFLGDHQLTIKHHGKVLHTETVTVDHDGQKATVHVQGTGSKIQVSHVAFG